MGGFMIHLDQSKMLFGSNKPWIFPLFYYCTFGFIPVFIFSHVIPS